MSKRTKTLVLACVIFVALSSSAPAAGEKEGRGEKDPWKGRVGIGLSLGLISGPGGSGFFGQPSLTYWWSRYFSTTAAVGYGLYTVQYLDFEDEEQSARINFVPGEFLATFHLMPGKTISPYLGPGVGVDYIWYTLEEPVNKGEDEDVSATIYSAIGRAGVLYRASPRMGLLLGLRYTKPVNTTGDFEDEEDATISLDLGLAVFL